MFLTDEFLGFFALDVFLFQGKLWWFFVKLGLIWGVGLVPCFLMAWNSLANFFSDLGSFNVEWLIFCAIGPAVVLVDWFLYTFTCLPYNERQNIFKSGNKKAEKAEAEAAEEGADGEDGEAAEEELEFDIENCDQYSSDADYFGCLDLCEEITGVSCE